VETGDQDTEPGADNEENDDAGTPRCRTLPIHGPEA
jgi:hypothetical protein